LPPLPTRSPEQKHRRSEIHGATELRLGCSSAPTNPRNRTSGDPSCLPYTFPAGPSPPLAGIEICPPAMAPGTL
jgi:hypothetical protein